MQLCSYPRTRESLDTLPEEVLSMILSYGYVKNGRRLPFPTVASVLARVNRQLRRLLIKYCLRSIQVNGSARARKFEQLLQDRPDMPDMVRYFSVSCQPVDTDCILRQVDKLARLCTLVLKGVAMYPGLIEAIARLPLLQTADISWEKDLCPMTASPLPTATTRIRHLRLETGCTEGMSHIPFQPLLTSCLESLTISFHTTAVLPRVFMSERSIFTLLKRIHFHNVIHWDAAGFISAHRTLLEVNVTNDGREFLYTGCAGICWPRFCRLANRLPGLEFFEESRWRNMEVHEYAFVRGEDSGPGIPSVIEIAVKLPHETLNCEWARYEREDEKSFLLDLSKHFPCLQRLSCQMGSILIDDFLDILAHHDNLFFHLRHLALHSLTGEIINLPECNDTEGLRDCYSLTKKEFNERLQGADHDEGLLAFQLWADSERRPRLWDVIIQLGELCPWLKTLHCYIEFEEDDDDDDDSDDSDEEKSKVTKRLPLLWIWEMERRVCWEEERLYLLTKQELEWEGRGRFSPRWRLFKTLVGSALERDRQRSE